MAEPGPHKRPYEFIAAAAVFVVSFIVYCLTLAPTVAFVDSGELIAAANDMGVAHPPGFPLYLIIAHIATLVPIGSVALRVNGVSALFAGLTAAMVTLAAREALLSIKDEGNWNGLSERSATLIPAACAGLTLAFARTLWAYGTLAEVYTLNTFLMAAVIWLMLSWQRSHSSDRRLYIAAFVFGLGLCVHHVSLVLMLPALAFLVYKTSGQKFFASKRFLFAFLAAAAALSIYAYLPIAASRSPLINWGDVNSLDRLWWHISGRQYQTFFDIDPSRITEFLRYAGREFARPWLPLTLAAALAGLVFAYRRQRTMFWFLLLLMFTCVAFCLSYEIADDKDAYYLPAFLSISIAAAFGLRWLLALDRWLFIAAAVMLPAAALTFNYPYNNRAKYTLAHDYVSNVLASVEQGGMVLTADWQLYSPSWYVRDVEGARKDVTIIDTNLMKRSWYFGYLAKAYPDVYERSKDKITLLVEDIRRFERDPAAFNQNAGLTQRINQRFAEVVTSLINNQLQKGTLYVTMELADPTGKDDVGVMKVLGEKYELVPQGLVFRARERSAPGELQQPDIITRGLDDGSIRFEEDDIVRRSVIPVYVGMLSNDGMYLASHGMKDQAIERFEQALRLDPSFEPAKKALSAAKYKRE